MRGSTRLAPYALIRSATQPIRKVSGLRLTRSMELLERARKKKAQLNARAERLANSIYSVVPECDGKDLRRAVIQLRRDLFNSRRPDLGAIDLDALNAIQDSDLSKRLIEYRNQWESFEELEAQAASAHRDELASLCSKVWALLEDRKFSRAVLGANGKFLARAWRHKGKRMKAKQKRRIERTLVNYLTRSACKTSPLGSFMRVNPVGFDALQSAPCQAGGNAGERSETHLNRGIVAKLYEAALDTRDLESLNGLRLNSGLRLSARGRAEGLVWRAVTLLDRPWRQEQRATFRFHPGLLRALGQLPARFNGQELVQRLRSVPMSAETAQRIGRQLIERGVVLYAPIIDTFSEDELGPLEEFASGHGGGAMATVLQFFCSGMRAHANELEASSADRLGGLAGVAESHVSQAQEGLGLDSQDLCRPVISQTCFLEGEDRGTLGRPVIDLLGDLADFVQHECVLNPAYLFLEQAFNEEFGVGECSDPLSFLSSLSPRLEYAEELETSLAQDRPPPQGTRFTFSSFVQLFDDGDTSETRLVVNRVYEGIGWMAARFAHGDTASAAWLRSRMAEWITAQANPEVAAELPIGGHCNDLQAHPMLTKKVLAWPGEPLLACRPGQVPLESLRIVRNKETGLLKLVDPDGIAILPIYLGAALPTPGWGSAYWLRLIANPVAIRRPKAGPDSRDGSLVQFVPRTEYGSVVLRRARWFVDSNFLATEFLAGDGLSRLKGALTFCRKYGIPERFYAQVPEVETAIRTGRHDHRAKPLFIDVAIPWCLDLLERLVKSSTRMVLSEPLPDTGSPGDDGCEDRYATEILAELAVEC